VLTATLLARERYVLLAGAVVAASGGNALLNITLKHLIRRARPVWDTTLATAQGWSFPSGHTSGSIATYGVIAYVLVRTLPARWRLSAVCIALTVMIVTAWSRLIIGVHFASDVFAGSLSGSAWLTTCVIVAECVRRRRHLAQR
jgi:undecaprenyl-diphosphatase